MYSQCISGDNPYNGTLNFDNILQSLEIVFVIMSANTFTDILCIYGYRQYGSLFIFIGCIFVMTVWLINVFIVVASFNITRMEVAEERKRNVKEDGFLKYLDTPIKMSKCTKNDSNF